jgi:hypothetical protein
VALVEALANEGFDDGLAADVQLFGEAVQLMEHGRGEGGGNRRLKGNLKRGTKRKRDFSLRKPTLSQERKGKKKSACSVRNDGGGRWSAVAARPFAAQSELKSWSDEDGAS